MIDEETYSEYRSLFLIIKSSHPIGEEAIQEYFLFEYTEYSLWMGIILRYSIVKGGYVEVYGISVRQSLCRKG